MISSDNDIPQLAVPGKKTSLRPRVANEELQGNSSIRTSNGLISSGRAVEAPLADAAGVNVNEV